MKLEPVSRRELLRGALGVGISLPFLEAMVSGRAYAQSAPPKRFLTFYFPRGCPPPHWNPTGTVNQFTLSSTGLAPLEPHKQNLVVVSGLLNIENDGPGADYHLSHLRQFTGRPCVLDGSLNWTDGCGSEKGGENVQLSAAGPTLDQQVIPLVGGDTTRFRSLLLGAGAPSCGSNKAGAYLSWAGAGNPLPTELNATVTFNRLFAGLGTGGQAEMEALARLHRRRASILDTVKADHAALRARLGRSDGQRLDAHLESIRSIEARLTTAPAGGAGCTPPAPPGTQVTNATDYPGFVKLQLDLMVQAMACDLVRVGTFHAMDPISRDGSFTGFQGGWHSHWDTGDVAAAADVAKVAGWFSAQLAYLLAKMKSIPEGNGTLLDNSLVYFVSDMGYQTLHWMEDVPVVLAGRAGGALQTGRFILNHPYVPLGTSSAQRVAMRAGRNTLNDLHRHILNLFGSPATTFGDAARNKGPIAGLL